MRILEVTPTYPPAWSYGGITKVVYEITKELSKRGHDVEVWASDAFDRYSRVKNVDGEAGAKVRYFKNLSFALTRMFYDIHITPGIVTFAKDRLCDFDVVHLHGARTFQSAAVYPYAKKYGVPYVLQAHGAFYNIGPKQTLHWMHNMFFGYRLLRDASKAIALSRMEAEQYGGMGVPEEKIAIIPNGIDLTKYSDLPPKGRFKKKFLINENEKMVLYLGRIHKAKGIGFLIKAYVHLTKNFELKDAFLVIAGPDDGYLSEAKSLVSALGVSDRVLFTGMLTEYEKVLAFVDSSLVISPERFNVFLLVPLEAAACGKPVIVSCSNYIRHMITEGGFGFSVKYGDVNELAEIMGKMLKNDKLLREMGQRGRKFIFKNCDWANVVAKLEKVYEETVE